MADKIKDEIERKLTKALDKIADMYAEKIADGSLTASEQKNFIQLLKDNDINLEVKQGSPLEGLLSDEDFDDMEEWSEKFN